MLIGRKELTSYFEGLVRSDNLAQAYFFFGEPEIGKFSFAKALANRLEGGDFDLPERPLRETLILEPETSSLGIEAVKSIKNFVYRKPIASSRRAVIVDGAETLTDQAQNALLKIVEEPPISSLIILVSASSEGVSQTLLSRFQKIYFPPLAKEAVESSLRESLKMSEAKAADLAKTSFGHLGRTYALATDSKIKALASLALRFAKSEADRKEIITTVAEDKETAQAFLAELLALWGREPQKSVRELRAALRCLCDVSRFNVNRRLQFEALASNL